MHNLNIDIKKTNRKKTVSFQIEKGIVKILVPKHLDKSRIDKLIKSKSKWIKTKLSKVDQILPYRKKDYVSGEDFLYLGKHYRLKILKGKKYNIELTDKYLKITIKSHTKDNKIKRLLKKWYFNNADNYLSELTNEISKKTGLNYRSVKVRNYKSRWGSCSSNGKIYYNWKIIMAPIRIIKYVICHELAHLKVHNHSPKFWMLLRSMYPNLDDAKTWLIKNKNTLDI
jgi:hypothetical protein